MFLGQSNQIGLKGIHVGTTKENNQRVDDWGWDEELIFKGEEEQHRPRLGLERTDDVLG